MKTLKKEKIVIVGKNDDKENKQAPNDFFREEQDNINFVATFR